MTYLNYNTILRINTGRKFDVFLAVKVHIVVFWLVTSCVTTVLEEAFIFYPGDGSSRFL
jgi:hypothetical protein